MPMCLITMAAFGKCGLCYLTTGFSQGTPSKFGEDFFDPVLLYSKMASGRSYFCIHCLTGSTSLKEQEIPQDDQEGGFQQLMHTKLMLRELKTICPSVE